MSKIKNFKGYLLCFKEKEKIIKELSISTTKITVGLLPV